jgi:hypothetical protein
MNDHLVLPTGDVADAALAIMHKTVDKQIADHSLRSFHFARLTAQQEGLLTDPAYDEGLLFAATVMHDLGLGTLAEGNARFEVEGADIAAKLLAEHGVPDSDISRVWEAIALHSSLGLADRMGLLTYLTHKGVFTDGGRFTDLSPELQEPVRLTYPRSPDDRSLQLAIVNHARKSPNAAPPFSIAAELLRQTGG